MGAKETLIIPEDAGHKFAEDVVKDFGGLKMKFAYQDFYAYQFIDKLKDVVRRALKVKEVFSKKSVSEPVKMICGQAHLTFIHGYHTASIALCRSIVEASIKARYNINFGSLGTILNKYPIVKKDLYAKKILDKILKIKETGDKSLHQVARGKIPSESTNLKILGLTQEVLQALS